jgi:hypothetical protein
MAGRQESKALKRLNFDLLYYSLDHWRALNDLTHKSTGKCLKVRCVVTDYFLCLLHALFDGYIAALML